MSRRPDFYFEEIDSTQDYLKNLVRGDDYPLARPYWAQALRQSRGRGRSGRSWLNSDGALLISCAFRVEEDVHNRQLFLPFVSFIAFASLYRTLLRRLPELQTSLRFKWPNDLVSEIAKGRFAKVAGILCEGCRNDHLIVGWGINVGSTPADLVTQDSASIEDLLVKILGMRGVDRSGLLAELAENLMNAFEADVTAWLKNPLALQAKIIAELGPVLTSFLGRHGNLPDGRKVEASKIDERGILWVRDLASGALEALHSGEFLMAQT